MWDNNWWKLRTQASLDLPIPDIEWFGSKLDEDMEETIDLKPYFTAVYKFWWLVLGTIALFVLGAIYYYQGQNTYRAVAWVAITEPSQRMQFEPRIESTQETDLLLAAYPELAVTDEILNRILPVANQRSGGKIDDISDFRQMLDVEQGDSPRLLRLSVKMSDPLLAAEIANLWADYFANAVSELYRNPGDQTQFFQEQASQSLVKLQNAQDALVEFQSRNRQELIKNELNSLLTLQSGYLSDQTALRLLLENFKALRAQLDRNISPSITFADQLTALSLQLQAFNSRPAAGTSPLQLQLDGTTMVTTSDRGQQLQILDELIQSVNERLAEAGAQLPALELQILDIQSEQQSLANELERLTRQRDIAQETYVSLARKLDEVRIESQDEGNEVQVASRASVPTRLERISPIYLLGIAIFLGALFSIAFVVILTWIKLQRATSN